jgi:hypothetical protein
VHHGSVSGRLADLVDEVLAEPTGLRLGVRRHDDLVDPLGREDVPHRGERLVLEHAAVRRDPGFPQRRERPLEPTPGRGTTRVAVDDVALARLRHGGDDGNPDRALPGAALECRYELPADERLVGDDEDRGGRVRHTCASAVSRVGLMTAWRAPGTPYSYGPPTTCGISSKLKIGGGDDTCHSNVCARHGFDDATGRASSSWPCCRRRR